MKEILTEIDHRPYQIPQGKWVYYQEWNNALFLHWKIPVEILQSCVPKKLNIDSFYGDYYISLVAFTMQNIRPRHLPSLGFISDFHEINLRTYIDIDGKKGVYFLSIEAQKYLSAFIAKKLSGLPYCKADILRGITSFRSNGQVNDSFLDIDFEVKETIFAKAELDRWLTERYCLYFDVLDDIYRYDIHHKEWELKKVNINKLNLSYKIGNFDISGRSPTLTHYSHGVKVIAWKRTKI